MPTKPIPDSTLRKTIERFVAADCKGRPAARAANVPDNTFQNRLAHALIKFGDEYGLRPEDHAAPAMLERLGYRAKTKVERAFSIPKLPTGELPIEELVAQRKAVTKAKIEASAARELIRVPVKMRGPVGFFFVGDPHVDDDGCDIERLEHDLTIAGGHEAIFVIHVGDITNNWVGRLAMEYARQSTNADQARQLAQWMFDLAPPFGTVGGNHDWFPGGSAGLIDQLMSRHPGVAGKNGVRIALQFPNGFEYRVHVRHDFPGKSQFSHTHGMKRELLFGYRDHMQVAGHLHVDEARIEPVNTDGFVATMVRVSGYKVVDNYADKERFLPKRMAPSVLAIVDPAARYAAEVTKLYWDIEEGADILSYKRRRKAA